jgi:hypothetical protein
MGQILKFPDSVRRRSNDRTPEEAAPRRHIPVITGDQWNEFIRRLTPDEQQAFMADLFKVVAWHLERINDD